MIASIPPPFLPFDVPVTPGADEARRWAAEELAKKVYQDAKPGLGAQILTWLKDALSDFLNGLGSLGGGTGLLVAVGVVVLAIIAAVIVIRPRLNRRQAQNPAVFDGPATLSAGQHRDLARSAVERGDLATAVAEQFRAVVRAGEERGATSPSPGRTAAEVAGELLRAFPAHGPALLRAAELFNAVRYGHADPERAMFEELVATDNAVSAARPVYADGFAGSHGDGPANSEAAP
ncbi:DUF4129 domain-containing protein [Arthrobacter livingstonensis]|uniref:DUF4129 domain-containing protein n=1 Tax=Arthrobacter livingstonensis TaxID=670078 RepID=A0A2V5LH23_9MICC|nr:DUF4129 domain-containing protein [Arthrobacter livingstonensis]PYI69273.1 DUF4129 domain-containing protein [Arthrobacter livingstonensis]